MASQSTNLKEKWIKMPEENFEVPTFVQVETGHQFICLPTPGPNPRRGGGFYKKMRVFLKTSETQAVQMNERIIRDIPDDTPIIYLD